ncbi:hypothetical protein HS041_32625 [Planomonospora sp. ID67723]|uniref:hypothetical protein n=1 Tax=Planomonospora sp. ID67723 TaxID=2738134 RepID=UPI0018C44A9D|nr:hypothetical protein [Planomonospora sp. ID67723]MBG0832453.1 hypothetical protein [Planomonospora sp. ID67723]
MRLVRRYRFGSIAAFVAVGYALTLVVAAVIALAGGDGLLRRLVFPAGWSGPDDDLTGWAVLPPALAGGMQGWALWQILRGWVDGERPRSEKRVRRLRGLLYADLLLGLTLSHPFDLLDVWWVDILWSLGQLAVVVLFHRVLEDASRLLRLIALVAGTLTTVAWQGRVVSGEFGFQTAYMFFDFVSQHVVEVGYRSPGGEIVLGDPMGGSTLPDLALRGRSGDYRIRVHYAWLPWNGEKYGAQHLLIMAYPGRGDDVVVHRERTRP